MLRVVVMRSARGVVGFILWGAGCRFVVVFVRLVVVVGPGGVVHLVGRRADVVVGRRAVVVMVA